MIHMYWMLLHDVVYLLLLHSICFYPRIHGILDRASLAHGHPCALAINAMED
jgi:hypothetical protein